MHANLINELKAANAASDNEKNDIPTSRITAKRVSYVDSRDVWKFDGDISHSHSTLHVTQYPSALCTSFRILRCFLFDAFCGRKQWNPFIAFRIKEIQGVVLANRVSAGYCLCVHVFNSGSVMFFFHCKK